MNWASFPFLLTTRHTDAPLPVHLYPYRHQSSLLRMGEVFLDERLLGALQYRLTPSLLHY